MNDMTPFVAAPPSLIPETAPFSDEQRSWLNGFFAGLIALDRSAAQAVAAMPLSVTGDGVVTEAEDAPWHDQTLSLADRMALAEGRPLRRRMMAAMAQQDCGQCGYNCNDYANAIAGKQEERLNLCVPGGKETARMLKALHAEIGSASESTQAASPALAFKVEDARGPQVATVNPGTSRDFPAEVTFLGRRRLNSHGSEKETWHIDFDLAAAGLDYTVGDSFGIFPANDEKLAQDVLGALNIPIGEKRGGRPLIDMLQTEVSLGLAPDSLFQLFSYLTGGDRRQKAKALAAGEDPDRDAATLDVLAALQKFAGVMPDPEALIETLEPLQPRLYSISSSPKTTPGLLSLTVDTVRYRVGKRARLGVASTFLAEHLPEGARVKAYVQKAHNFGLPSDPATPIIMVGPGTGIAPFRAFLQERDAMSAPGKNWLFFGHQRSACDFFYKDELTAMKAKGLLTRLSLAWSRDDKQKFYVQDRMREVGRELWAWLQEGAHFYVCGDAQRMAKDVERALVDIAAAEGKLSADSAVNFVKDLKKSGRYQADVY